MISRLAVSFILLCASATLRESRAAEPLAESRASLADNPHRPLYHLSSPGGKLHDPGGFGFWQGRYHLFYIAPGGKGHAVSDDLVHWRDLSPIENIGGLTGQMVVTESEALISFGRREGIYLAESSDPLLEEWTRRLVIPVEQLPEGYQQPIDSNFWQHDGAWWMLLRRQNWERGLYHFKTGLPALGLFRSEDRIAWEARSTFYEKTTAIEPGDDLACANFLPLGEDRHLLLYFCHPRGPMYAIGRYDTEAHRFIDEHHGRLSTGPVLRGTLHAPSAFVDPQGRLLTIFNVTENREHPEGWIGTMSLPRVVSLREDYGAAPDRSAALVESNLRDYFNPLRIEPVEELANLRFDPVEVASRIVPADKEVVLPAVQGKAIEIDAVIQPGEAREIGLHVLRSPDGRERTTIRLYLQGAHGRSENARSLSIDRSIIEVFANDRQCLTVRTYPSRDDSRGVSVFAKGGDAELVSLRAWQMRSIWPELKSREGE
jgi:beta-fructofuranosidase